MRGRGFVIGVVALVVFVLDLVTKHLVSTHLPLNQPWNPVSWLEPYVSLTYIQNTGGAFGILHNQNLFFTAIAIVVITIIIAYLRAAPQPNPVVAVCLGMQLGGAFGNLVYRLRYGYVVDFVDVKFWPIFNVADSSISVGTAILALYLLFFSSGDRTLGHQVGNLSDSSSPPRARSDPLQDR